MIEQCEERVDLGIGGDIILIMQVYTSNGIRPLFSVTHHVRLNLERPQRPHLPRLYPRIVRVAAGYPESLRKDRDFRSFADGDHINPVTFISLNVETPPQNTADLSLRNWSFIV